MSPKKAFYQQFESVAQLTEYLRAREIPFELIYHGEHPPKTAQEAARRLNLGVDQIAPVILVKAGDSYYTCIKLGDRRLKLERIGQPLAQEVEVPSAASVERELGVRIGNLGLLFDWFPVILDQGITEKSAIWGGSGLREFTLKMAGRHLLKAHTVRYIGAIT